MAGPPKKTGQKQGKGTINATSRWPVSVLGHLMIDAEDIGSQSNVSSHHFQEYYLVSPRYSEYR